MRVATSWATASGSLSHRCLGMTRCSTTGRPASLNRAFITALSIPAAEASTPAPTYGMPASSRSPWTVPSSPYGPWSMISTTSSSRLSPGGKPSAAWSRASAALAASAASARATSPSFTGLAASPAGSALRTLSARAFKGSPPTSQRPSLVIPIGTGSKRLRSRAPRTDAAEARETSCSPERPPKMIPTRIRPMLLVYHTRGGRRPSRLREADDQGADQDAGGEEREGPPPGLGRRAPEPRGQVEDDAEDRGRERAGGESHSGLKRHGAPEVAGLGTLGDARGEDRRLRRHHEPVEERERDQGAEAPPQNPAQAERAGAGHEHDDADEPRAPPAVGEEPGHRGGAGADGQHRRSGEAGLFGGERQARPARGQACREEGDDPAAHAHQFPRMSPVRHDEAEPAAVLE